MSKYGYVGKESDIPQQAFKANAGVLSVNDHLALSQENKLTQYGQLELIETQTITSSTANVEFTNLGTYNVHFITANNFKADTSDVFLRSQVSNNGGSSYISTGYQYARQRNYISGGTGFAQEGRSTNTSYVSILGSSGNETNRSGNGYCYLYNLLDSSKYSFGTFQAIGGYSTLLDGYFGSAVLPTAETHNAIRVNASSGNIENMNISLYGIKEYS